MGTIIGDGITFDDVLLVPAYSEVIPNQVDLTTNLTKKVKLNIPLMLSLIHICPYGAAQARRFARELCAAGVQIISGMARGIDGWAHRGALESGGDSWAVLGCGADICYPRENRDLYRKMGMGRGGLISEYPPGQPPLGRQFPARNRIISALSDVVLVVEAKEQSGSLITADFALEPVSYTHLSRVVSARELSLEEIRQIRDHIPEDLEIETFVHGAMCISYSGRCLLSSFLTGRDANQGACTHPCRWKYSIMEETRPGEYFPVYENERGTFIFNSKDLCMICLLYTSPGRAVMPAG